MNNISTLVAGSSDRSIWDFIRYTLVVQEIASAFMVYCQVELLKGFGYESEELLMSSPGVS